VLPPPGGGTRMAQHLLRPDDIALELQYLVSFMNSM
jgi:hypothetical protein